MFGMSGEHLLILGIVLLIFGPRRLPELGNTLGRSIRNFKDAISGIEEAKFRKVEPGTESNAPVAELKHQPKPALESEPHAPQKPEHAEQISVPPVVSV